SLQAAALRGLELAALRQTVLSAVPACPPVSLACPPANLSCPVAACPPPICPPPVVNINCPSQEGGSVIVDKRRVVEAGICGWVLGGIAGAAAAGLVARQGDFILIRYDLPGAPLFHERVVTGVGQSVPGLFAALTADGDHFAEETRSDDVAEFRWSGAQGATPPGVGARQVYRFRAMPSDAELEQLKRDGVRRAAGGWPPPAAPGPLVPAGGAAVPAAAPAPAAWQGGEAGVVGRAGAAPPIAAAAPAAWLATEDFRGLRRGERLPDPLPPNAEVHGDVALVPVQGGWVTARLVPAAEIDALVIDDLRVLLAKFSQEGAGRRPFTEAVDLQVADEPEGDGDRSIHEHEVFCRVLEPMISVDQLNAPALQSAELVCRRLRVIEDARAVSPSAPDYSAADENMGWSAHRGGSAVAPALRERAAANLRDKAAVIQGGQEDIPEVDAAAPAVETVLDPIGRDYALDYESRMMLASDEWPRALDSEPPVTPYMDEVLKSDPDACHLFISDLVKANMLGFTFHPKNLATPSFVAKKSGAQRLVWGARVPNRRFRAPPSLSMGASAAYGRLHLPGDRDDAGVDTTRLYSAQVDVRNYFYALGLPTEIGLYFSLPPVSRAA
ncbi:unnamed protein product, partial [Prorocentrum cordatum]